MCKVLKVSRSSYYQFLNKKPSIRDIENKNIEKAIIEIHKASKDCYGAKHTLAKPSVAIYSKDNLIINGTGKLTVKENYKDGITSKDDLKITGGNIQITSCDSKNLRIVKILLRD